MHSCSALSSTTLVDALLIAVLVLRVTGEVGGVSNHIAELHIVLEHIKVLLLCIIERLGYDALGGDGDGFTEEVSFFFSVDFGIVVIVVHGKEYYADVWLFVKRCSCGLLDRQRM